MPVNHTRDSSMFNANIPCKDFPLPLRHSTEIAIFCPTFELAKTVCECFSLGGLKLDGQVAEVQVWVALLLTFECSSRRQSKTSRSLWKAVLPGPRSGAIGVKCETQDDSESVTVLPGRDRLGSPKQCDWQCLLSLKGTLNIPVIINGTLSLMIFGRSKDSSTTVLRLTRH